MATFLLAVILGFLLTILFSSLIVGGRADDDAEGMNEE